MSSRPAPKGTPPKADAPLTAAQRTRVRKLIRRSLLGVVGIQILALGVIATPQASATGWPVFDFSNLMQAIADWGKSKIRNEVLSRTENITGEFRDIAKDNIRGLGAFGGHVTDIDADAVAGEPVAYAMERPGNRVEIVPGTPLIPAQTGSLSYTDQQAAQNLSVLMPVDQPWDNYQAEYIASATGAATTIRASVEALNNIHTNMMQDDTRLEGLRTKAQNADSDRAIAQLNLDGQIEMMRHVQRANAINALQTNMFAVAELQRINAETRSVAKDQKSNCEILAMLGGGLVGGVVGEVGGSILATGC